MLAARFSVPAFLLLTGLVLAYAYRDRPLGKGFLVRRLRRSIVPWLFWAPVYFAFGWFTGVIPHDATHAVEWFKEGGGHLYFLLIVPQFYLLFMLWPKRHRVATAFILMAIQTVLCVVRLWIAFDSEVLNYLTIWYGFLLFPYWMGYFAVGVCIAGEITPKRRALTIGVAAISVVLSCALLIAQPLGDAARRGYADGTGGFLVPWMPLLTLSITGLLLVAGPMLMRRSAVVARVVMTISDNSLGIYIVHPILLTYLGNWTGAFFFAPFLLAIPGFIAFVAIVLVLALLATRLIVRTPLAMTLGAPRISLRRRATRSS